MLRLAGPLCGLAILCGCSLTEPSSPFGTYDLVACLFIDSIPRAIPCGFEQPNPGDTVRFDSGTFALRADSTWASTTYHTNFLSGNWGTTTAYTDHGTFSSLSPYRNYQVFQLHTPGIPDDPRAVAVVGRDTLTVGVLLYTR
jgi:hypothetical protein